MTLVPPAPAVAPLTANPLTSVCSVLLLEVTVIARPSAEASWYPVAELMVAVTPLVPVLALIALTRSVRRFAPEVAAPSASITTPLI